MLALTGSTSVFAAEAAFFLAGAFADDPKLHRLAEDWQHLVALGETSLLSLAKARTEDGRYHVVDRWTPNASTAIGEIGRELLRLAEMEIAELY